MANPLWLALILFAGPPTRGAADEPAADAPPEQTAAPNAAPVSATNADRFKMMQKAGLMKSGMTEAQAEAAMAGKPIPISAGPPQPSYEDMQRQIAKDFPKYFHKGKYEDIVNFEKGCKFADGCDRLAAVALLEGTGKYVALQNDVYEKHSLQPDSPDYAARHQAIKSGMHDAMDDIYPKEPKQKSAFQTELTKVADPVVSTIFSQKELLIFAQRNAAQTGSAPSYAYLGDNLSRNGQAGRAREAYDQALAKDPNNEQALAGRAKLNFDAGNYKAAAEDARAAVGINPQDQGANATYMLSVDRLPGGNLAGEKGAPAAAPSAEGPATLGGPGGGLAKSGGEPSSPDASRSSEDLAAQGKRSLTMGDTKAAVETLSQAVSLNPRNAQALSLLSMAENRQGKYKDALAAAEAGLKLAPKSTALLNSKAFALNRLKDYKAALAAADMALSVNPHDPLGFFNRAAALQGLGDRPGMIESLRAAAALDQKFAPILQSALENPSNDEMLLLPGEAKPDRTSPEKPAAEGRGLPSWPVAGALAGGALAIIIALLRRRRAPISAPPPLREMPKLLGGTYEVGEEIGSGGMGVVYKGTDRSLERPVAIKRMREEIRWDQKERERFISEAKLVAKLQHPNIVGVLAIVEENGEVYLIFEYISGKTLNDLIGDQGKLRFDRARDLFRGVASALDYAHGRGVIHRDLKPSNVMVDAEGRSRVMDFGIARLAEDAISRHTSTKTFVGTPLYMAPEQEQSVARKESDVYAMALCLYEALTGRPPFAGSGAGILLNKLNKSFPAASSLATGLPKGIDEIFARALEPAPEKRYANAGELLRALEALEAPARAI